MKKLFLLAGLLFCVVLVKAMGAVEPPGKIFNYAFVCSVDHQDMVAPVANVVMLDHVTVMDYAFINLSPTAIAEMKNVESYPLNLIQNTYNYNPIERGHAVARSGVINCNDLYFKWTTINFKARARSWVNLTNENFPYLCASDLQLCNFDGKPERFY